MFSEDYKQTIEAMTELRDIRNELVQHFIERLNISGEAECLDGALHLQGCSAKIENHLKQLSNWTSTHSEIYRHAFSFFESEESEKLFVQSAAERIHSNGYTILEWLRALRLHVATPVGRNWTMRSCISSAPTAVSCLQFTAAGHGESCWKNPDNLRLVL